MASGLGGQFKLMPKLLASLESILAAALALDPNSAISLAALEGKRVALNFTQPALRISMQVRLAKLVFDNQSAETESDLTLKTTPGALLGLVVNRLSGDSSVIGKIHIAGDAELAQHLQKWLSNFDPDWDELISRTFGDVLGFQIARGARGFGSWLKRSASQFASTSADYLQDESRDIANRIELESWYEAVDDLRDAIERTARRIDALAGKISRNPA
jgi:ubiquinone biosynthesis accessory factor UbiJ